MTLDPSPPASRRRPRSVALGAVVALSSGLVGGALALAAPASAAGSTDGVYSYSTPVSMANGSSASVDVPETGLSGLSGVSLTLSNVTDSDLTNVDVTLASPSGSADIICGQAGAVARSFTYNSDGTGDATCVPGDLSNLLGGDPAGAWTLSIQNPNNPSDSGSIAGGFSIAMTAAPAVTDQPTDISAISGDNANFTAHAAGLAAPTVQWQKSTDGTTFTDIPSATTDTLNLPHVTTADNSTFYQAVFTNSAGTTTSNAAMLTVGANTPTVGTQPTNQSVVAGTDATFTVAASGDPTPAVQWQSSIDAGKTFNDITGATSASYTVSAPGLDSNASQYRAVVTNDGGSTTSDAATLTVTGRVPSAPGHFAARQTGLGQVTVSWTTSTDSGSPATIQYYQPGWGTGQMGDGDAVSADKTTDVFNHLQPGKYTFSVAAINAAGSSVRVAMPLTVVAPTSTPTLTAGATRVISGTHVLLSGQGPASQHVTLQRELPGGRFVSIATVTTTNFGHYAFTVPAGHTAYYRVRAASGALSTTVKVVALDRMSITAIRNAARHYTLSGKALPAAKGQLVKLYAKKNGGSFALLTKVYTNKYGHWTFTHVYNNATYTFKAVAANVPLNAGNSITLKTLIH